MKHLFTALLFTLATLCQAELIQGKVVGVIDGDTIDVLDTANTKHRIRLAGIDAPEKSQAFGQKSKESLSDLVFARQVEVNTRKKDRHGRRVGKVLVNGRDANLEQIRLGMAWFYREYERELSAADRELYDLGEQEAKRGRFGLWADANPMPPAEFRKH